MTRRSLSSRRKYSDRKKIFPLFELDERKGFAVRGRETRSVAFPVDIDFAPQVLAAPRKISYNYGNQAIRTVRAGPDYEDIFMNENVRENGELYHTTSAAAVRRGHSVSSDELARQIRAACGTHFQDAVTQAEERFGENLTPILERRGPVRRQGFMHGLNRLFSLRLF